MGNPNEQIAGGLAGCGCLGVLVLFVVGVASGAGFVGSVVLMLVALVVVAYVVSLVR
jgi:hypothetical protein